MVTKRVILANDSRLLQEMLRRVLNKAEGLEVVQEIASHNDLPSAIEHFSPEWVILSLPDGRDRQSGMDRYVSRYPSVRFVLLSPESSSIKLRWQTSYEEDLTNVSLKDFIQILEKDLQHI